MNYMKNGYNLIWTNRAFSDLEQIIDYLENNFSKFVIKNFLNKLQKRLLLINDNPLLFPVSYKFENTRKSVLSKQVSLYYKVASNSIYLLSIYDNRQSDKEIK